MKKLLKQKNILLLGILMVPFSFVSAVDVAGNDVEIILDCSGSMAGMIENKSKMDIAKEAISTVADEIPDSSRIGFRAYGHQSGRDAKNCTDSELIYPIGELDRSALKSKVNSLEPRGWTPIEYSLKQSKNDFSADSEFGKMIILVSDGEETCDGDPCQAVKDLKAGGFDVTVNTVGFDVGDVAEQQLKCIADATGGQYFSAKSASDLIDSLRELSKRAFEGFAMADKIEAGTGFINAPLVEPGEYGGDVIIGEKRFYKVDVRKGQELALTVNFNKEHKYGRIAFCNTIKPKLIIYNKYKQEVGDTGYETIPHDDTGIFTYSLKGEINESGQYYINIATEWMQENCYSADEKQERNVKNDMSYEMSIFLEGEGEADASEPSKNASTQKPDKSTNTTTTTAAEEPDEEKKEGRSFFETVGMITTLILVTAIIIAVTVMYLKIKKKKAKNKKDLGKTDGGQKKCSSCNANNPATSKFCNGCGKEM